jgi:CBS domain containing-hemolysin-like protein
MTIALAPIFWAARWLFTITAIVPALTLFGKLLAKVTGAGAENQLDGAREQVISLLQEGVRAGVLSERQSGLIDRAMELRDTTVTQLMRPWNAAPKMEENWTSTKAQWLATKQPKNRYIVIDKHHKPTGAISAAAVWTLTDTRVTDAAENIITLKPTCTAQDALEQLLAAGARVAVVTRGQSPIGIVTVRSLIEPLTGELGALEV